MSPQAQDLPGDLALTAAAFDREVALREGLDGCDSLDRVRAAERAKERERCARLVEADRRRCGYDCDSESCAEVTCVALRRVAAAIRAGGGA